jgi:hypothetical protein
LRRGAPSTAYTTAQRVTKPDPRSDRIRLDFQHPLENTPSLLQGRRRNGPNEYGPSADQQILRIGARALSRSIRRPSNSRATSCKGRERPLTQLCNH